MNEYPHHPDLTELLYSISRSVARAEDWRPVLDDILQQVRPIFIFDNLAIYTFESGGGLDVAYAKAIGRGKLAEADVAWGESIANQVISSRTVISKEPAVKEDANRLQQAYMLGIPLEMGPRCLGSLVIIRFGGPKYTAGDLKLAEFLAQQISVLVEQEHLNKESDQLKDQQRVIRIQEDFISTISHEFRTPLGFIKGYATTLLRSDTTWNPESQREFLRIIDQETDRLQELIDNVLDSARLQNGQLSMDFQIVRLDVLMTDVIARAQMHHPNLQVQVKVDPYLPSIQGDPSRLAQVFENLLNNAYKYAPDSVVEISMEPQRESVQICLIDHGPGIPGEYLPHIFERFYRIPGKINIHGSGLGLWICDQIIQAHQGQIKAESRPDEGTRFTVLLPYSIV